MGVLLGVVLFADGIVFLAGCGVLLNLGCSFGYGFASNRAKIEQMRARRRPGRRHPPNNMKMAVDQSVDV